MSGYPKGAIKSVEELKKTIESQTPEEDAKRHCGII